MDITPTIHTSMNPVTGTHALSPSLPLAVPSPPLSCTLSTPAVCSATPPQTYSEETQWPRLSLLSPPPEERPYGELVGRGKRKPKCERQLLLIWKDIKGFSSCLFIFTMELHFHEMTKAQIFQQGRVEGATARQVMGRPIGSKAKDLLPMARTHCRAGQISCN